jgi:hypothetical protein
MAKKYNSDIESLIKTKLSYGLKTSDIYKELIDIGHANLEFHAFQVYVSRLKKKLGFITNNHSLTENDEKLIKILENEKINKISDIRHKLGGCSERYLREKIIRNCRKNGYEINISNDNVILSKTMVRESEKISQISNCSEVIFGIVSDPHFGSKSCQITALNEFANIMKKQGVKHIFVPGDMVSGFDVYPGQIHDVYAISAKDQEETTLLNLPTGFDWYVLGGNHDYSFIKKGGGYNIISVLASKRSDIHYIGFDEANVPILNNVDVKLGHPSGGVPYSVSYRLQKSIEQITISELQNVVRGVKDKPTIRFVLLGHLHIQMQAMFGSIWGAQCGSFEGQTNYLKRKGLVPSIGGYIIKATLGNNGLLKNFDSKFYLFNEIEDDWRNYNHSIPEKKIISPIFDK